MKKDSHLGNINSLNFERKNQKLDNVIQGESYKRVQENSNLALDLMEQIKQKRAQETLEKINKFQ